ncbi:MAG TPA: galactose oxidase early set domain-containing protein [Fimbriimonadaceae bacterium]|nr:galactose oxidase early set domain-containing protein [Fimbriimonadaceae bacterium]
MPIHLAHLPNGNLLAVNRPRTAAEYGVTQVTAFGTAEISAGANGLFDAPTLVPYWDTAPHTPHNIFCAGQTVLWDGSVMFAGGHLGNDIGTREINVYSPFAPNGTKWQPYSEMVLPRWYPSAVSLPNRRVLILAGTKDVTAYSGANNINEVAELWMHKVGPQATLDHLAASPNLRRLNHYYPFAFIDPKDGQVFIATNGRFEDTTTGYAVPPNLKFNLQTLNWTTQYPLPAEVLNVRRAYPSCAMVDGTLIRCGGSRGGGGVPNEGGIESELPLVSGSSLYFSAATTNFINLNAETPTWTSGPDMNLGRKNHCLVALPDARVIAMGGNYWGDYRGSTERLRPEIWDPQNPSNPWQLLEEPPAAIRTYAGRGYHSTAVLLPDARVLMSGGEWEYSNIQYPPSNPTGRASLKRKPVIFSPPYGGTNNWQQSRPTIVSSPSQIRYGTPFVIDAACFPGRQISKISLVPLVGVSHAFASNQATVLLNKSTLPANPGRITVNPPTSTAQAIPGFYMLFVVDNFGRGIPSVSKIVQLRDLEPGYPDWVSVDTGTAGQTERWRDLIMGDNTYAGGAITANANGDAVLQAEAAIQWAGRVQKLRVQVEASAPGCTMEVDVYNYVDQTWVQLGSTATTEIDQLFEFNTPPALSGKVVSAERRARTRVRWHGPAGVQVNCDLVEFGALPALAPVSPIQPLLGQEE